MSPRKMTEPDGHSDACKSWQTSGHGTEGKHDLQAAARPRASRQKRNGRRPIPLSRPKGERPKARGLMARGVPAPRRSPKRASARARAPALRRGQRNGRKSHNNPKAMMEPKNDDDALLGGMQGYETPWRARRGKRKRKPRTRSRGKGGPTPRRGRRTIRWTLRGDEKREGRDGASSESPHGWRGGEGGWVGVPRQRRTRVAT